MPWDGGDHAGFSTSEPWLPLNEDWHTRNVAHQTADEGSMLTLYRRLLALRRAHPALSLGDIVLHPASHGVLVYERIWQDERLIVALNLTRGPQTLSLPESEVLLSTLPHRHFTGELAGDEGLILKPLGDSSSA
jgi:glycosidase